MVGAFLSSAISEDKNIGIGSKAPKIETIEGGNVVNDANSGDKTIVVSFWSPKIPASRISNRNLSRMYGENENDNFKFISICTDSDENLMNEVIKIDGLNKDLIYPYSQISPRVFKDYDVAASPGAFIISPDGKIQNIYPSYNI